MRFYFEEDVIKQRYQVSHLTKMATEDTDGKKMRTPSLTGEEESDRDMLQEWQEQALVPIKEDVTEWLVKTLGKTYQLDMSNGLLLALKDGVGLCKLLEVLKSHTGSGNLDNGEPHSHNTEFDNKLKDLKIKWRSNAKAGTWFARDNIANFLQCCRQIGVKEECLFETEDLVNDRNEKCVLLCLLELARIGMKLGLEPPALIALEKEIDQQETEDKENVFSNSEASITSSRSSSGNQSKKSKSDSAVDLTDGKSSSSNKGSRKQKSKLDKLDSAIDTLLGQCTCDNKFVMDKISAGRYKIGGKQMFVRLLKDRHIMIRVGGGWDTLQHYILTHDACRIIQFKRDGNFAMKSKDADFAHAKGRYKSASSSSLGSDKS